MAWGGAAYEIRRELDEIQGIADGQRLPVETLESILFPMYSMRFENHCTCFAFSNDSETVFARNSDFLVSIERDQGQRKAGKHGIE